MKDSQDVCDETIFNDVYENHGQAIWRFIYFKCGDQAQADDLVQESFIKLWQNCAKIPLNKAKSFLYTVCNNVFLNEVAHKKVVLKHAQLQPTKYNAQSQSF